MGLWNNIRIHNSSLKRKDIIKRRLIEDNVRCCINCWLYVHWGRCCFAVRYWGGTAWPELWVSDPQTGFKMGTFRTRSWLVTALPSRWCMRMISSQDVTLTINNTEPLIMWTKGSYCIEIKSTVIRGNWTRLYITEHGQCLGTGVEKALGPHM
jgi:hypothetical protein